MNIAEKLKTIRVLWRQPETLNLWGIPYLMREGQSPTHLWKEYRNWKPPEPGHYGSNRIDISDWVCLGYPGWYGTMSNEEVLLVKDFLAKLGDQVPGNPYEWCVISNS
jgi:hypothetical protein